MEDIRHDRPAPQEGGARKPLLVREETRDSLNRNRIHIYEWRTHGDNEDYVELQVFAADQEVDMYEWIRKHYNIPDEDPELMSEYGYDPEGTVYTNADMTICDGDIMKSESGRKFRISIVEII